VLRVALEGIKRLLNVRKTAFLAKNVSPRVARFLAGARWRWTVNDPDRVAGALRENGLSPSEEMVRTQAIFGGVVYRGRPHNDCMSFDLFPVKCRELDGMRIAEFEGFTTAQYGFGIAENGNVMVNGGEWNAIASSLEKFVEGQALLDALCGKWHHASWKWLPSLSTSLTAVSQQLLTHLPDALVDQQASDRYSSWFVLDDACVSAAQSWDEEGRLWVCVFADGQPKLEEVGQRAATALGV
jgi:hypothetical protein